MTVAELIEELKELPQEDEIVITSMDDYFYLTEFSVHSPYEDGQAQEIILGAYIDSYSLEPTDEDYDTNEVYDNIESEV